MLLRFCSGRSWSKFHQRPGRSLQCRRSGSTSPPRLTLLLKPKFDTTGSRSVTVDGRGLPVIFAVRTSRRGPRLVAAVDGVELAGTFVDRLRPVDGEGAARPQPRRASCCRLVTVLSGGTFTAATLWLTWVGPTFEPLLLLYCPVFAAEKIEHAADGPRSTELHRLAVATDADVPIDDDCC